MKIAISTNGTQLSSLVAPLPGSGVSFIVYDPGHYRFTVLGTESGGDFGALKDDGWVDIIAGAGIDVLVVGGIALGIAHQLRCSGIRIYECVSATVWEAIQALKLNLLRSLEADSDESTRRNVLAD